MRKRFLHCENTGFEWFWKIYAQSNTKKQLFPNQPIFYLVKP